MDNDTIQGKTPRPLSPHWWTIYRVMFFIRRWMVTLWAVCAVIFAPIDMRIAALILIPALAMDLWWVPRADDLKLSDESLRRFFYFRIFSETRNIIDENRLEKHIIWIYVGAFLSVFMASKLNDIIAHATLYFMFLSGFFIFKIGLLSRFISDMYGVQRFYIRAQTFEHHGDWFPENARRFLASYISREHFFKMTTALIMGFSGLAMSVFCMLRGILDNSWPYLFAGLIILHGSVIFISTATWSVRLFLIAKSELQSNIHSTV